MEVFHSFQDVTGMEGAVVALGTFDGVHLGHQKVMRTAMAEAKKRHQKAVVVTFSAHPFPFFAQTKNLFVSPQWRKKSNTSNTSVSMG